MHALHCPYRSFIQLPVSLCKCILRARTMFRQWFSGTRAKAQLPPTCWRAATTKFLAFRYTLLRRSYRQFLGSRFQGPLLRRSDCPFSGSCFQDPVQRRSKCRVSGKCSRLPRKCTATANFLVAAFRALCRGAATTNSQTAVFRVLF